MALWQASWVREALEKKGSTVEICAMETKGDKVLDVSINKIGSKGVFTEELEELLASGEIDFAVHSAKDMQSKLPQGFEVIAFSPREKVNDVIISDKAVDLTSPELILGTSSTRRVALFRRDFPQIELVDMRGNLQTRIQKMRDGACHGLVLAFAGVHRMGYDAMIRHLLPLESFIPAVGQGSIAIETHKNISPEKRQLIRSAINDPETEKALLAERAFLKVMDGGCSVPIFALAEAEADGVKITGGIISLDGKEKIVFTEQGRDSLLTGIQLAEKVLKSGGDQILSAIKRELGH